MEYITALLASKVYERLGVNLCIKCEDLHPSRVLISSSGSCLISSRRQLNLTLVKLPTSFKIETKPMPGRFSSVYRAKNSKPKKQTKGSRIPIATAEKQN